jgi:hypothetical protein
VSRPGSSKVFQPRFSLGLLYFFGLFFLYCMAFAAPPLFEIATTLPPEPENQELAYRAAKDAVQPRLWVALALAVLTLGIGAYANALPGLRRRRAR